MKIGGFNSGKRLERKISTVFWWENEVPNLGDELAKPIMEHFLGMEVNSKSLQDADFLTVGSILGWAWGRNVRKRSIPLEVVGSGFMKHSQLVPENAGVRIHSVRGYLTAGKLNDSGYFSVERVGDPALYLPRIYPQLRHHQGKGTGIVLHYTSLEDSELVNGLRERGYKILDIRTRDVESFLTELIGCERIISESLHGLIMADAFGIPNAWLELRSLHAGGDFKFLDYFSSIGRPSWLRIGEVPFEDDDVDEALFVADKERIAQVQNQIRDSYHSAIRTFTESRQLTGAINPEKVNEMTFHDERLEQLTSRKWIFDGTTAVRDFKMAGRVFTLDILCGDKLQVEMVGRSNTDFKLIQSRMQQLGKNLPRNEKGNGFLMLETVKSDTDVHSWWKRVENEVSEFFFH